VLLDARTQRGFRGALDGAAFTGLLGGGTIRQETRDYDGQTGTSQSLRSKEMAHDYRYFPDPDLMPVRVDANVLADLKGYIPLAPLHQPFALEAVEILLREQPDLPQMACFDTAFHHTLPQVEKILPLPYAAWERGLRRYGFHGLSYEYMAVALPERHGDAARGRTVVAHLGSGASLCAMQGLKSMATTMGFSALDGLMMGTRTGALGSATATKGQVVRARCLGMAPSSRDGMRAP